MFYNPRLSRDTIPEPCSQAVCWKVYPASDQEAYLSMDLSSSGITSQKALKSPANPWVRIRNMFAPVTIRQTTIYNGVKNTADSIDEGAPRSLMDSKDLAVLAKTPRAVPPPSHAAHAYEAVAAHSDIPDPVITWLEPHPDDLVDKRV